MKSCFIALGVLLFPSLVSAADSVLWKELNGWQVYMDPTMGNACYVTSVYEDGTLLRMGFNFSNPKRTVYFAVGNQKWKSLEAGKEYPVGIRFDDNPAWNATSIARDLGTMRMLTAETQDTNFLDEFIKKLSVRVFFNSKQVAALRLKGSGKAIDEMLLCQRAVSGLSAGQTAPPQQEDPFQAAPTVKNADDPFEL